MSNTIHDEQAGVSLDLTWELDPDCYTVARFAKLVVDRTLDHVGSSNWACERDTLEGLFDRALATQRDRSARSAVVELGDAVGEGCIAHVSLVRGTIWIQVAARDIDLLAAARLWLRERYPVAEPSEEQRVSLTFWSLGTHAPRRALRQIDVPTWPEVATNYPPGVEHKLAGLMGKGFQPGLDGRLLLWHGPPGTGKTYALRALGWEWRSWCDLHYVTDPETFFGSSSTYMLHVLLDEDDEDTSRWRLLILEDTGELLAADAKERTGQGLSRLLNVVDGLIGQGLRVLVLVTTNETLRTLHPAVSRPGRCASQIEFAAFTADEAAEWLAARGVESTPGVGTLASLFAREAGAEEADRRTIGFAQ